MKKLSSMKKMIRAAAAIAAAVCLGAMMPSAAYAETGKANVKLDPTTTYQTIDGFGASYTWYSDWLATNKNKEEGFDWIFNDAEFNILRFRDLHDVQSDGESMNAKRGYKAYRAYYDAAVARGIDPIVLVTSWGQYKRTLPFVAFTEKDANGHTYYTLAKDEKGEYMYDALAEFCVESIQLFFDAGLPVHYFSISNETELQGTGNDEQGNARDEAGFYFGATETEDHCAYWKAHIAVYEAFKKAFGDKAPKITGAEVMADTNSLISSYITPLQNHAPESFDTIAHHLYGSENTKNSFQLVGMTYSNKYTLWQTEFYYNNYIGQAEMMANELAYENISAYLYWNGVWIEDDGNCLIEIDSVNANAKIKRNGNHYIMMHFSKYIKRGYQRIRAINTSKASVVAFKAPDDSRIVLVAVNNSDKEEDLVVELQNTGKVKNSFSYRSTGTANGVGYKYWQESGEFVEGSNVLPPLSVTTYVLDVEKSDSPDQDGNTESSSASTENGAGGGASKDKDNSKGGAKTAVVVVVGAAAAAVIAVGAVVMSKKSGKKK